MGSPNKSRAWPNPGPPLTGIVLLMLMPVTASAADTPSVGGGYASEVPQHVTIDNKDGAVLAADDDEGSIPVAQELEFILENSFRKTYDENLKTVAQVEYYGTRYVDCEQYPLEVRTARPDRISMLINSGVSAKFEISKSNKGVKISGTPQGLGIEEERALLETFAFDTPVIELEKNRQVFKPLGMQKLPGMLTWKLEVDRPGGYHRILYVDSHTGDIDKFTIVNAQGAHILDVVLHDYRVVDGIRVPFAIDYRRPDGALLANDRFESVKVKRTQS
jgi:hypothetical protein